MTSELVRDLLAFITDASATEERFNAILQKQWPDEDKRRRAHVVIDTSRSVEDAREQISHLLRALV